ncbi:MAG: LLM class flavin-dependent oxidoreductase [Anaerolineae bacterium]|jgi:5,10-methylenetetrahydromethanopterin reductase|nr:LLM class flavin-dependent oxidoreductase [Anaerolineae bacterium]
MRYGLYLQDDFSLRDSIKYVQYAEMRGFESVWQAESRLARDAIVPMAAYLSHTTRIKVGSGVINHWTHNAAAIAMTFLTLDDLAPDRVMCGLGTWWEPIAQKVGVNRTKPLLAMREVVQGVRALLSGQRVTYRGEFVQLDDVMLDVIHGRREPRQVPIYIGATAQRMVALAGEIADGVLLNFFVSPAYNREAMDELERGLKQAGRSIDSVDRPQLIVCSVDPDRVKALNRARRVVTQYLVQQPKLMRACGVRQELLDELAQVLTWNATPAQIEDAMRLVPDDVVQLITASGSADEVRAKVQDYITSGATCAVLYPIGDDVRYMIDVFADRYVS